jgi:hypothetical protein
MTIRIVLLLMTACAAEGQDFAKLQVEEVASGFPGGEGPVWSREGFLIFRDYSKDRLYKYLPGKAPEVYRRTPTERTEMRWTGEAASIPANTRPVV